MDCRRLNHCRTTLGAAIALFAAWLAPEHSWAAGAAVAYGYPYQDPWIATSSAALMQGVESVPGVDIRDLRMTVRQGREHIFLEGQDRLIYRFYQQRKPGPLVFIVPGFGSSPYAGTARFLAELLARQGFHVLVLPSTFHWNFALAVSRFGLPGYGPQDAEDLYQAMQLTLADARRRWGARITQIGLLGLSAGAMSAARIAEVEDRRKNLDISTYLLINPPVDMLKALRRIDAMAAEGRYYSSRRQDDILSYAAGTLIEALQGDPKRPGYYLGWDRRIALSDREIAYLIGQRLQSLVGEALYVSDLAQHFDVLKTPISWDHRNERLDQARSLTLAEYLEKFVTVWRRRYPDRRLDRDKLNALNSLWGLEPTLENNRRIFLMHNGDDVLLSPGDMNFLKRTFRERAIIYPHGGHLGNIWYARNQGDILAVFRPLLY